MRISCHVPITLRIVGVPTDDQLATVGTALTRAVAARLAEAERLLADRHGRPGATAVAIREPYDPAREGAEGYAVPSYGHDGDPVAVPERAAHPPVDPASAALPKFNRAQRVWMKRIVGKLSTFHVTWNDVGFADGDELAGFLGGRPVDAALEAIETRVDGTIELRQVREHAEGRGAPPSGRVPEGSIVTNEPTLPEKSSLPRETTIRSGQSWGDPGGNWDGPRGNSRWYSDLPEVEKITKDRGVRFKNGYPRFEEYAKHAVYIQQEGTNADFAAANRAYARMRGWFKADGTPNAARAKRYMKRNRLTWHHVEDGTTMLAVPFDLHKKEATPHIGGASGSRLAGGRSRAPATRAKPPVPATPAAPAPARVGEQARGPAEAPRTGRGTTARLGKPAGRVVEAHVGGGAGGAIEGLASMLQSELFENLQGAEEGGFEARMSQLESLAAKFLGQGDSVEITVIAEVPDSIDVLAAMTGTRDQSQILYFRDAYISQIIPRSAVQPHAADTVPTMRAAGSVPATHEGGSIIRHHEIKFLSARHPGHHCEYRTKIIHPEPAAVVVQPIRRIDLEAAELKAQPPKFVGRFHPESVDQATVRGRIVAVAMHGMGRLLEFRAVPAGDPAFVTMRTTRDSHRALITESSSRTFPTVGLSARFVDRPGSGAEVVYESTFTYFGFPSDTLIEVVRGRYVDETWGATIVWKRAAD